MRQDGSAFRSELSFGHSGTGAEMSVQFGPINPVPKCPGTEVSVSQSSTRWCWWSTYVRLLITTIVRWVTDDRRTWCQHQLTYQSIIQQLHSNTSVNTSLYSPNDEPEEKRWRFHTNVKISSLQHFQPMRVEPNESIIRLKSDRWLALWHL